MKLSSATTNRRSFIACTAAALATLKSQAQATPEATPESESSHYLLTGVSTGSSLVTISGVEAWNTDLENVAQIEIQDGVIDFNPTGREGIVLLVTMFGSAVADINASQRADIQWDSYDPGYVVPALPDEGEEYSSKYLLGQGIDMGGVFLIDLETLQGRDIAEHLTNESTELFAVVPDIPQTGSIGGIWTGDNVYLLDFENPEEAEKLVGDDPDWYSTTLNLDDSGKFAIYTTYDPADRGQTANVYFLDIESGEHELIMEGHAWTSGRFIPNNTEHFIALSPEGLELRNIATPADKGELISEVGQMGLKALWFDDGKTLLYGHRQVQDGDYEWLKIDMDTLDTLELPDLIGRKPVYPRLPQTRPEHLLFIEDEFNLDVYTFAALDISTGEVWSPFDDEIALTSLNPTTASTDGRWYTISSRNEGALIGTWLVDMQNREVVALDEVTDTEETRYSEYAAVSPDGSTLAIQYLTQPESERTTVVAPTSDPADQTDLTNDVLLGWV